MGGPDSYFFYLPLILIESDTLLLHMAISIIVSIQE